MKYFLIVYSRRAGVTDIRQVFDADDRSAALRCRMQLEAELGQDDDLEVVVLGAASEDELRQTHARYFISTSDLIGRAFA